MIRRHPARGARRWPALALGVCLAAAFAQACSGAGAQRESSEDSESEMVGAPPSEQEDPFRIAETPEASKEAGSTGYIGSDEESADAGASQSKPAAVRASKAEPSGEGGAPKGPSETRCFSCVRICPLDDSGATECDEGERDVICGWGVHDEPETARRLARAECNGALEMAREMKTWSRIEGDCPRAECREPGS